jgi:PAS domain S-box-containing protein
MNPPPSGQLTPLKAAEIIHAAQSGSYDFLQSVVVYIADATTGKYQYVSPSVQPILGYSQDMFQQGGIEFMISRTHPDDYVHTVSAYARNVARQSGTDPGAAVFIMDYRLQHAAGHWVWLEVNNYILSYTAEGYINQVLAVVSEISEKKSIESALSNHPLRKVFPMQYLPDNAPATPQSTELPVVLLRQEAFRDISNREKDVLKRIAQGYTAQQIAYELNISVHTAVAHRKNLITKFGVKNTAELVKEAFQVFWLG